MMTYIVSYTKGDHFSEKPGIVREFSSWMESSGNWPSRNCHRENSLSENFYYSLAGVA